MKTDNNSKLKKKVLYSVKMFRPSLLPIITLNTFISDGIITSEIKYRNGLSSADKVTITESLPRFTVSKLKKVSLEEKVREHLKKVNSHLDNAGTNGNVNILEFLPEIIKNLWGVNFRVGFQF